MKHVSLTKTQLGIYSECLANASEPIYHLAFLTKLTQETHLQSFAEALRTFAANHSFVKLRYAKDDDGVPYQYLAENEDIDLRIDKMSDEQFEAKRQKWPKVMALDNVPLAHFRLIETPTSKWFYHVYHHSIFDGGSLDILARGLDSILQGKSVSMERLSIIDIAEREEQRYKSAEYEAAKQWYTETFGGIDTDSMPLPDVDSHSDEANNNGTTIYSHIFTTEYEDVFSASRRLGVKMSILADGAFGYTSGVFIGGNDALFSTIYNGRKTSDEADTIAMMVKTLPVYCSWNKDTTVLDYLHNLHSQREGAKQHDIYSFADVCSDLQLKHNLMFAYRGSFHGDVFNIPNVVEWQKDLSPLNSGDGVTWVLDHIDGKLKVSVEYHTNRYSQELIESWANAFDFVLKQMCSATLLSEISLVDRQIQLETDQKWHTELEYDESKTLVDLWREQAYKTPAKIAIVAGQKRFSYAEIDDLSDRLAAYLHSCGIGGGDVVAIIIPRNEFMAIASLGVMKSGAAYQPLDPSYPTQRLNFMVKDSSAKFMIADPALKEKVDEYSGKVLLTYEIRNLKSPISEELLEYKPQPSDRMILLYTSGSTGTPKACQLTHANIVDFLTVIQPIFNYDTDSKVTAYASYGFDASMSDLYPGLTHGATIHIIGDEIRFDMVALNDYFTKEGMTHAFMTTQIARAYAMSVEVPRTLKFLTCGGEAFVQMNRPETYTMINAYGPTEATTFVTYQPFDSSYDRIPIGKSLPNVKLYVVDKNGNLLPPLAMGELCIAGRQVSMGYLNRPEKTAEVFVDNPFTNDVNYLRMYKTGDVVRRLKDGRIDFIGRNDGQVKVRGFRIELSEVEAVVSSFPDITDATVVAYDDPAGGKFIAAYIVSKKRIDVDALESFIAERKPHYMVPAVTMQIESIPLNQNQKVDKRALPKPEFRAARNGEKAGERRANILESILVEIVTSVLKQDKVEVTTPLELLGLTSISSIKLAMAIYKRFGFNLKTSELLGNASIETIENRLLEYLLFKENSSKPNKEATKTTEEHLPLTISQRGVYADSMRNPESTNYNIPLHYRFPKEQNVKSLANSVRKVFELHPYLRSYFILSGTDVEQRMSSDKEVKIETKTMTDEQFVDFKQAFVRPFNLMKAPLYRIEIVTTENSVNLLMDIHHIIFDGTSVSVIMNELQTVLNGGDIVPEALNYYDYIQKELATSTEESKQFFAQMLKDCEAASDITPDLPPKANGEQGDSVELYAHFDFSTIDTFCRGRHITPAALMLAAVGYVVGRFTGSRRAYLSTISSGREDVQFAETIGMFVKTLPVAIEIADITAGEFADKASETLKDLLEHEVYPYSTICQDYNYSPNILYAYQLDLENDIEIGGNKIVRESFGTDVQKFKIELFVEKRCGKPAVIVQFKNGLYSDSLMQTFVRSIAIVAERIAKSPEENVRKISMLTEGVSDILQDFSKTKMGFEAPIKLFHKLFEKQVDLAPNKEILVATDGKFTYQELEERANSVANALIEKGLKCGESVVVLVRRTSNFFTSVFGINKAGGVFIPTNPEYPQERIKTIQEDSGARFIITEADLVDMYDNSLDVVELNSYPNTSRPSINVLHTDLAYMIYTSGSTGKPKGVEIRHESICNYMTDNEANPQVWYRIRRGSCYGAVSTVAFDGSFDEWAVALCGGLKLAFASDEETLDPMALVRMLSENRVDVFNATPSRLLQYLEVNLFSDILKGCKVIGSGGEKYPQKLLDLLTKRTDATILNLYGPTEATVASNVAILNGTQRISVGRPLLNYQEYIVDSDDNMLPIGVVGELIISGVGVGNGYHNLPEQTNKAFIEFQGKPAYRSGDYARWLPNGDVEILGRKDNQVKLRGLRIELGEIERVLTNVGGVKSGIVLIRKVNNQEAICAYYTLEEGVSLTPEAIKSDMASKLTSYMVPTAFIQLDEIPITANGKTNIKALPEPEAMERAVGRMPETDTEKVFAKIFADVLQIENIYADDNFFELGGTSLTVTRVIIAAAKAGIDLAYADVFSNPTPEKLAVLINLAGIDKDSTPYSEFEDISKYDYGKIDELLQRNTLESFISGEKQTFSHVLLTGATGFLGVHVLHELLHYYPDCKVTCLLRGKRTIDADTRLQGLFYYYFEELPFELFGDRLTVVDGDITHEESFEQCKNLGVDLVINCAANVKHFSKGTDIEDVNYYGTLNIINYCQELGARFVHVSTTSVGGAFVGERGSVSQLNESMLYYGQKQLSKYTQSKFLAERAILQAVAEGKLSAKIMRVGNLAPRNSDGEYQINFATNSFMARLKSTYLVGVHSFESETATFELSPVDSVARAILLLTNTPKENVIFHTYNNHLLLMGDLYDTMARFGLGSKAMEEADYQDALNEAEQDPLKVRALTGLLAYRQKEGVQTTYVSQAAPLTVPVLSRLGFHWPTTDTAYSERFIIALRGLGFFDE